MNNLNRRMSKQGAAALTSALTYGRRFLEPFETQISVSRWCTQTHLFSPWRTACAQPSDSWGNRACGRRTTGGSSRLLCCPERHAGREKRSSDREKSVFGTQSTYVHLTLFLMIIHQLFKYKTVQHLLLLLWFKSQQQNGWEALFTLTNCLKTWCFLCEC